MEQLRQVAARSEATAHRQHAELLAFERQVDSLSTELLAKGRQIERIVSANEALQADVAAQKQHITALQQENSGYQRTVATAAEKAARAEATVFALRDESVQKERATAENAENVKRLEAVLSSARTQEAARNTEASVAQAQAMNENARLRQEIQMLQAQQREAAADDLLSASASTSTSSGSASGGD